MSNVTKPENRVWNPACECLPKKDLEALQLKRLKKVVKTAWDKVPYYRAKMETAGVALGACVAACTERVLALDIRA